MLALTACSSSTRYVISGTVPEDLNGKYIYMLRNGNFRYGERNTNLDSAWVENGKFRFIGNDEETPCGLSLQVSKHLHSF